MKRCYFLGMDNIYDPELMEHIENEVEKIVIEEDQIEFWFFSAVHIFDLSCLHLAVRTRSKHPNKDIKIVRVYDPVKSDNIENWYDAAYDTRFPRIIPNKNIFAPVMDEGFAKIPSQFIQQMNKVERWILRQMDVIFAYNYPRLDDSVTNKIRHAQTSSNAKIIQFSFEETKMMIQDLVKTHFDKRTTQILEWLTEGLSHKEIGKRFCISSSRVGQIAGKAGREIRHIIKTRYCKELERECNHRVCGMAGLNKDGNALQLVIFDSMLHHLTEYCGVTEFWVDEESCETGYGERVAIFCAKGNLGIRVLSTPTAKVVVCIPEENDSTWSECIQRYVPPYSSVVHLGISRDTENDFYKEMIRQSEFFITDFTNSRAPQIKNLCGEEKSTSLIDISCINIELSKGSL